MSKACPLTNVDFTNLCCKIVKGVISAYIEQKFIYIDNSRFAVIFKIYRFFIYSYFFIIPDDFLPIAFTSERFAEL